uniref:ZP domain-containing protein n=1 Tax=Angiostrongylus cantonensis TaxID=6313 RepID=A0A158P7A0_ANGCA
MDADGSKRADVPYQNRLPESSLTLAVAEELNGARKLNVLNNISGFGPELRQFDLETTAHLASTSKQLGFVPSEAINVQAECHTTGINVSFLLNHKHENYTGVIYAAERFEQCRLFVRSSSEFSIFIPRPRYNTWCALLPSLMTPMELGTRGWESSLSAFRIDGSEQIDVVCMLDVCPDKTCPEVNLSCPPSKERPIRSLFERPAIRVCHRLIVRTGHSDGFQDDRAFPELCLQPTVYLFGLFIMMLSLTVLTISACVGARRRRDSAEDLSVSRFPVLKSDMGAKYIKTLSL